MKVVAMVANDLKWFLLDKNYKAIETIYNFFDLQGTKAFCPSENKLSTL